MKRIVALLLAAICLCGSAGAITVSEFAERYNADIGKGFHATLWEEYIVDSAWFLSDSDQRNLVIVTFDPASAEDPKDCTVTAVALRHKPRVSVAVFLNNVCAALAAAFPDVSEEERLAEAMRCFRCGDQVHGLGYFQDDPVPYDTAHMGQFVYQEETDWHTFLFSMPE